MNLHTVRLPDNLEAALRSNHPWVYKNHLPHTNFAMGEELRVEAGRVARYGVFDTQSQIAVRLFGEERITEPRIRTLVQEALAKRAALDFGNTDAYRLIHGESDYLPGVVADRYGRYAIIKAYSESVRQFLPVVARTIGRALKLRGVAERIDADGGAVLTALFGQLPPEELTITEHGLKLLVNTVHGQKTGLFLDQRDNRQFVREHAHGARVLNLFAYTGGFSLAALAGGANHVTSVDISQGALAIAERQLGMNGFVPERHDARVLDIFGDIDSLRSESNFDIVVVDPPSLANNQRQVPRAFQAYRALNASAAKLVAPGGMFVTASCTAQVTKEAFQQIVRAALHDANVDTVFISEAGHAADHPVIRSFPEGQYLSRLAFRVLG